MVKDMATESKTVTIYPLNGSNYPTWKIQCQMALMKDGLWSIVNGSERAPEAVGDRPKFMARKDRALATIVLSVDPSLLYLIGTPEDPVEVWSKLENQFQKKTWANKLELRRKLYSLRLKDGDSVQSHIKAMTEIFNSLSVVGDPISGEDQVVYLLASLPESYSMLVTALEANAEVPNMELVTERLLHEEIKLKGREEIGARNDKVMTAGHRYKKRGPKCHHCGKFGHIKRNCRSAPEQKKSDGDDKIKHNSKQKANAAELKESSSDNENVGLVVQCAMSSHSKKAVWIVDSGATCHMCNDRSIFMEYENLKTPQKVTLGDGYEVNAVGRGAVVVNSELPSGRSKRCTLHDVLYVPRLSHNLFSVSMATKRGKTVRFGKANCQVLDEEKLVAVASKIGELYYLKCNPSHVYSNTAKTQVQESKEDKWHRRFGHLGVRSLQKLATEKLVNGFDYDSTREISFCQACVEGKLHKSQFPTSGRKRADKPLGLVHSDVCGKISTPSLCGGNYFLTFIDDYTHYVWIYILKRKDQVFEKFIEWKAVVENSSGRKLKTLRTDNGGEYTSAEFDAYLKEEGVRHELTVPKTPQQNGVAERMNRTLVEAVRSMLSDAKLPKKFWAEALSTAVYLRNRSPTTTVQGKTPFEAWTKEKPDVGHLKVFGCLCFAHVAKDERQKFDAKARKCIMLGYGTETKAYRLYDVEREKVFLSRDVVFNETKNGIEKESVHKDSDTGRVQLECSSEEDHSESSHEEEEQESPQEEDSNTDFRRSSRERRKTDFYGVRVTVADASEDPTSLKEVLASTDKTKWVNAMEKEMESLHSNDVWDLVELPKDKKAVGSKWVFKTKKNANGTVERHKARLVAQGYSQQYGQDYDETFSPVVRFESLRTVIALAVQNDLKMHQMDVTTAFLNGELKEEVYMKQPEGYAEKGKEGLVCKLKKSIYGLKQSPRCWNSALDSHLKKMGFVQAAGDPCLYMASEGEMFLIAVYVDDILLAGRSNKRLTAVKQALSQQFQVKDMGELHYFLGAKIIQDHKTGSVWIGQQSHTENILRRFGMEDAKEIRTPVDTSTKLVKGKDEDTYIMDQQLYQSAVGSLLYLSIVTRPDITYAVSNVAKFCAKPTKQHWVAVKRIFRYLKGTQKYGLLYSKKDFKCVGFSDADWGGDLDDRKSTSGYMFQVGGTAISWRSKKQSCVALSTAEAEYIALASAAQESLWLQQLLSDLKTKQVEPMIIFEDNQSAISMSKNPQFHGRSKYIAIKYHFIREQVCNGKVELKYCKTNDMVADIMTKGLSGEQFEKLRLMAGVAPMIEYPETSEKEC